MQIAAVAMNINLLICITLPTPLRLQTFSTSGFPSEEMFDFFLSPPSSSHHIFIESLSGVGKAEKEITMVPLRTVLHAKLFYFFSPFAFRHPS